MTPSISSDSDFLFLNYSLISERLKGADLVEGAAPRWIIPAKIIPIDDAGILSSTRFEGIYIVVIDEDLEKVPNHSLDLLSFISLCSFFFCFQKKEIVE